MPTYEYKCKKCGNVFEKFQSITAKPIKKCQSCDGEVYRLISKNGNFILKGSGYYSTDNRNSSYKSEKKRLTTSSIEGQEKKEIPKKTDSKTKEKKDKEISLK
ncbi:MAG TPA: FmdB family transcriptional regulator [Candidatus Atribacteria bacterium]|nr:FmdB family transcriptional regulator [Candidatus Atribacteria bacterium]